MNTRTDDTLLTLFETDYRPARLCDYSRAIRGHRRAIRELGRVVGHAPTLADLNSASVSQVARPQFLIALWRHAAEVGAAETNPVIELREPLAPDAAESILGYFEAVYLPARLGRVSWSTLKQYRVACRGYARFAGERVGPDHATPERREAFREWLVSRGTNDERAKYLATLVAVVARHAAS